MSSGPPLFSYQPLAPPPGPARLSTSRTELLQIGIAYAVLTLCLVLILSGNTIAFGSLGSGQFLPVTLPMLALAAGTGLSGFVAHELAHKVVAQRRGYWAEFRMWPSGLLFSFISALLGFLWGAPGATVVNGMDPANRRDWGLTSLAGPLANLAFAVGFYLGAIEGYLRGWYYTPWLFLLAFLNAWFGTFNLLPFGPLDGRKVLRWNSGAWAAAIVATGSLAAVNAVAAFFVNSPFLGL